MKRLRCRLSVLVLPALLTVSATFAGSVVLAQTAPPPLQPKPAFSTDATPQTDSLSIGPGLFTFPQIAALLSTPQQPITCDFAMKDRAAFVFLQNRSRAEAKELLGAGLQVEFVAPDAPTGLVVTRANEQNKQAPAPKAAPPLTMVRQKAVVEREADWLKRAARVLQVEMDRRIAEVLSYSDKPYADLKKVEQIAREADALEREIGSPPYKTPPATEAIAKKRARLAEINAAIEAEERVPRREERLGAVWVRAHPPAIIPLLQGKRNTFSLVPVPTQGLEKDWVAQVLVEKANWTTKATNAAPPAGFLPENYDLIAGYQAGVGSNGVGISARGSLVHQAGVPFGKEAPLISGYDAKQSDALRGFMQQVSGFGLHFSRPRTYTQEDAEAEAVNFPNEAIPAPLAVLGPDVVAWWKQEQEDTLACLKNLPDDIPPLAAAAPWVGTPPRLYDRIRTTTQARAISLSDALEGWTARTRREAVMELHPRVELWETWDPVEVPATEDKTTFCLPLSTWIHQPEPFLKERYVADQWSVRERSKVLLITSRMEFIERPQNAPLAELITLQSDLQAWYIAHPAASVPASPRDTHYLPCEPLAAYTRAVLARRECPTWDTVLTLSDYHNTNFHRLDETMLALFLWSKIGKKEQALLLTQLGKTGNGTVSIPMSQFGQATLSALIELMREAGGDNANTLLPKYQTQLWNSYLKIAVDSARDSAAIPPGYRAIHIYFREGENWTVAPDPALGAQILFPIPLSEKATP